MTVALGSVAPPVVDRIEDHPRSATSGPRRSRNASVRRANDPSRDLRCSARVRVRARHAAQVSGLLTRAAIHASRWHRRVDTTRRRDTGFRLSDLRSRAARRPATRASMKQPIFVSEATDLIVDNGRQSVGSNRAQNGAGIEDAVTWRSPRLAMSSSPTLPPGTTLVHPAKVEAPLRSWRRKVRQGRSSTVPC